MKNIHFLIISSCFFLQYGCAGPKVEKTRYHVFQSGKCWVWDTVEKGIQKPEHRCQGSLMLEDRYIVCSRETGHKGRHHYHTATDCRWIWGGN